jgi:hypothetical protein
LETLQQWLLQEGLDFMPTAQMRLSAYAVYSAVPPGTVKKPTQGQKDVDERFVQCKLSHSTEVCIQKARNKKLEKKSKGKGKTN